MYIAQIKKTHHIYRHKNAKPLVPSHFSQFFPGPVFPFSELSWYGKGPWETYSDRKTAAFTGLYRSTVSEQHVRFVKPCECGGHEDTRYALLSDGTHSVMITGGQDFHFSALPYSMEEYREAMYDEELPATPTGTWLIIDSVHAGLGGDTGWFKNIHPEYRIPSGRYSYEFTITFQ